MGSASIYRLGRNVVEPFIKIGSWYNSTAKAKPVLTGVITSGLKTSAADFFAQKIMEGKEEMDWKRHTVFCLFGFAYLGGFQYYLYNVKFVQWCSGITSAVGHKGSTFVKTFMDQCIHHPFMYFPTFYSLKAAVEGKPMSHAFEKYKTELWDSVKALWSIWVPAQLVNFAFVPRHLRVPYVAGVSFLWTVVLSCMQGKHDAMAQKNLESTMEILQQLEPQVAYPPTPIAIDGKGFAASGVASDPGMLKNKPSENV